MLLRMDGLITAIVGFIFVCVLFPKMIKNATQFYAAFALLIVGMFLLSFATMIGHGGFMRVAGGIMGLLSVVVLILLVLSAGGLSMKDLAGNFTNAFEVMRRGEDTKEVIVPLRGEQPAQRDVPPPPVQTIQTPPPAAKPVDQGSIPVE
jgi:hypothetical protein